MERTALAQKILILGVDGMDPNMLMNANCLIPNNLSRVVLHGKIW